LLQRFVLLLVKFKVGSILYLVAKLARTLDAIMNLIQSCLQLLVMQNHGDHSVAREEFVPGSSVVDGFVGENTELTQTLDLPQDE
jgi:hypothetical protein